jgi:hypothetical protein
MRLWFRNKTEVVETKPASSLRRACHEFGRDDLYETLSWVVFLKPRLLDANLEHFMNVKRYVMAANVMLFQSKDQKAKDCFEKALKSVDPTSARYLRLSIVLTNLNVVSKIARRSWELDGKLVVAS